MTVIIVSLFIYLFKNISIEFNYKIKNWPIVINTIPRKQE